MRKVSVEFVIALLHVNNFGNKTLHRCRVENIKRFWLSSLGRSSFKLKHQTINYLKNILSCRRVEQTCVTLLYYSRRFAPSRKAIFCDFLLKKVIFPLFELQYNWHTFRTTWKILIDKVLKRFEKIKLQSPFITLFYLYRSSPRKLYALVFMN